MQDYWLYAVLIETNQVAAFGPKSPQ